MCVNTVAPFVCQLFFHDDKEVFNCHTPIHSSYAVTQQLGEVIRTITRPTLISTKRGLILKRSKWTIFNLSGQVCYFYNYFGAGGGFICKPSLTKSTVSAISRIATRLT